MPTITQRLYPQPILSSAGPYPSSSTSPNTSTDTKRRYTLRTLFQTLWCTTPRLILHKIFPTPSIAPTNSAQTPHVNQWQPPGDPLTPPHEQVAGLADPETSNLSVTLLSGIHDGVRWTIYRATLQTVDGNNVSHHLDNIIVKLTWPSSNRFPLDADLCQDRPYKFPPTPVGDVPRRKKTRRFYILKCLLIQGDMVPRSYGMFTVPSAYTDEDIPPVQIIATLLEDVGEPIVSSLQSNTMRSVYSAEDCAKIPPMYERLHAAGVWHHAAAHQHVTKRADETLCIVDFCCSYFAKRWPSHQQIFEGEEELIPHLFHSRH